MPEGMPGGPGARRMRHIPFPPLTFRRMRFLPYPLCLALALLAAGQDAAAQAKAKSNGVVLYKERLAAQWDTVKCVKNVLKFNPLLFLRGEVPVYYERALSPRLSAELAVGITVRNYIGSELGGDLPDDFSAGTRIIPKPSAHIGFRWYLTDDLEPQGPYVQGEFAYLDHSKDIFKKDSTGGVTDVSLRDQRVYNDLRLYAGYQRLSGTSNWLWDLYGGIGFRNRSLTRVHEMLDLADRHWSYSVTKEHGNVPVLFLGVKVGYGF